MPPSSASEAAHRSAFTQARFRLYYPSSCLSTLGGWLLRFLFGWVAWDLTASAFWVGVVASLMLLPTFLLSPLFGITADRINPRNGLLFTTAAQGLLAGLAALAALLGALALEALVLLALVFGAVSAAHTPLRLALLPRLVERAALPSAIGLSAIAFNSSRIIAPAIGAGLLAMASPPLAFAAASAACAGATGLLWRVTGTARQPGAAVAGSFAEQLGAGFRYVLRSPGLRLVFLLTLTNGLLGRTALELLPAVSGQLLGGGSTTLATLTAAAGVGSIVGGLIVSRQSGRLRRLFQLALFGLAMAALTLLSAGFWRSVVTVALAISLVSLCTTMIGTGCQALAQLSVDEAHCGRVMSLWSVLSMGAPAIGAVALGSVADGLGFPAAFAASAVCALLVTALARPGGRRFQH